MMKDIWKRHHSLIQWIAVALLALLLMVWMGGGDRGQREVAIPEVVSEVEPKVVEEVIPAEPEVVAAQKTAESEAEIMPEPVVTEPDPAPAPIPEEEPLTDEPDNGPTLDEVLESAPPVLPEPTPEPASGPDEEPVVEQELEAELICPQWTESDIVSRGSFTSGVDRESREPVDSICALGSGERKIFYFSDLRNQFGKEIYHLWEYKGREMAMVSLGRVRGPRWRVWSSKNLVPEWSGEWTVKVVTNDGTILHQESFIYR